MLAAILGLAIAPAIAEAQPAEALNVRWSAPAECPSEADVRERVANLLAESGSGRREEVSIEMQVTATEGGYELRAVAVGEGGAQGERVVSGVDCGDVAEAGVLIAGESGVGKELAARAIHRFSRRAAGPFVAVNIASLSPSLIESELFGHVRGAFTGADQTRTGLLVQAHGGTLFLDEVAETPPAVQVKLLRVLDQGEVFPVGGREAVKTDFRVISATHQDLVRSVEAGTFRHDLYFRLASFQLHLPPLRERRDDIPLLAQHFLSKETSERKTGLRLLEADARRLSRYDWPGNVRELQNVIERAVILSHNDGCASTCRTMPPLRLSRSGMPMKHRRSF